MIRTLGFCAVIGFLAACGADGAPERPPSGVSGEARFGVVLN
jgi:hypothetical protein